MHAVPRDKFYLSSKNDRFFSFCGFKSTERNDQKIFISVIPKIIKSEDSLGNKINKKIIGIKLSPINNKFNKEKLSPSNALFYSIKETWFVLFNN